MPSIRIQKLIADSGYCSRRKAEELIKKGVVTINGQPVTLGQRALSLEKIVIDGMALKSNNLNKKYVVLNKPKGYVCTSAAFDKEKNIFSLLPKNLGRLFVAGRLDKDSQGLVLLTNDGNFCQKITHPSFEHEKTYKVKISNPHKIPDNAIVKELKNGIDIGEGDGVVKAKKILNIGQNSFEIVITQGKKRQIRRMFEKLDCKVIFLMRTKIGTLELGNLKSGSFQEISAPKI